MGIRRQKLWDQAHAVLVKNIQKTVYEAGIATQRALSATLNRGGSARGANPAPAGQPPHKNTGQLANIQIDDRHVRDRLRPRIRVGTNLVYARIHEFGGVIVAKKGYLTVPLNQEARDMRRRAGGSLRNVGGLVTIRSRKGTLLLGRRVGTGKAAKFTPLFALKKSVRMPARPYMRPTFRRMKPVIQRMFINRNLLAGFRGLT